MGRTLKATHDLGLGRAAVTYTPAPDDPIASVTFQVSHDGGESFGPVRGGDERPFFGDSVTVYDYEIPPGPAAVGYRVVVHRTDGKFDVGPTKQAIVQIQGEIGRV